MAKTTVTKTKTSRKITQILAEKRKIVGRKVKQLRQQGILPANIYGRKLSSIAIQVSLDKFQKLFAEVGETGLVDVKIGKKSYPALIHNVQTDPVTEMPLHADFLNVDLTQKVTTPVPLNFVGESPAEKSGEGVLVFQMHEIEVEALPTDLPESIKVDVSRLEKLGDVIHIGDLDIGENIEVKEDPKQIVAYVGEPQKEEEPEVPSETGEAGEAEVEAGKEEEKGEQKASDTTEESKEGAGDESSQ